MNIKQFWIRFIDTEDTNPIISSQLTVVESDNAYHAKLQFQRWHPYCNIVSCEQTDVTAQYAQPV